jgi:hypothetical protein
LTCPHRTPKFAGCIADDRAGLLRKEEPMAEDTKALELRIAQLEKKLAEVATQRQQPTNLTKEEIAAYQKVRDVIAADWGEFCGINDCFRCIVTRCNCIVNPRCIVRCINECVCGPCSLGPRLGLGGLSQFEMLGG